MSSVPRPQFNKQSSVSKGIPNDESTKMHHSDKGVALPILQKMNEHRKEGSYCDVTLVVGSHQIQAHRLVLSSFSRYFEGLLNPNMKEAAQEKIEIMNLNGESVEALVEFAYTSRIDITAENVEDFVEAANFLAIDSVCNACCDYMTKYMNFSNCVGVLLCAELYGLESLKSAAISFALKYFYSVSKESELHQLPVDLFINLIRSDDLTVEMEGKIPQPPVQESVVLDAVVEYLNKNGIAAHQKAVDVFQHVRIPVLDPKKLRNKSVLDLIAKNKELEKLVAQRIKVPSNFALASDKDAWTRPRLAG